MKNCKCIYRYEKTFFDITEVENRAKNFRYLLADINKLITFYNSVINFDRHDVLALTITAGTSWLLFQRAHEELWQANQRLWRTNTKYKGDKIFQGEFRFVIFFIWIYSFFWYQGRNFGKRGYEYKVLLWLCLV